jgi:translation initiation factor IF-2
LAAKRIFELAKELGIESKVIIAKCVEEGVSPDKVKNHMATVSPGLVESIREWFPAAGGGSVAVAESAPKAKAPKAAPAEPTPPPPDEHAKATPVVVKAGATVVAKPATPEAPPPARTSAPLPTSVNIPAEPPRPVAPTVEKAPDKPQAPAPTVIRPAASAPVVEKPVEPARPEVVSRPIAPTHIAPPTGGAPAPEAPAAPVAPVSRPSGPGNPPGSAPRTPVAHSPSVTMNVPRKPTVVSPAGPQLASVQKAPAKLSGPKVVRVEEPDRLEAPRPRRFTPGAPSGPGGGMAPRGPARPGETEDDRGRSPRRKGAGPGGPGAGPGMRRSTGAGVPDRRRATTTPDNWVGGQVFSEQDIIEREARLARAGGFVKKHKQQMKGPGGPGEIGPIENKFKIAQPFTIKELSEVTGVKGAEIVKKLFLQGVMATINSGMDPQKAIEIMMDFDIELEVVEAKTAEEVLDEDLIKRAAVDERPRGPVVTILGHVDHGKTSLLDRIRNANVAAGEAGGITQRTSAFKVPVEVAGDKKEIVFLDTPGHEAFTSMRSRGANMTDVIVLVVSAPEGVMPQTIESIAHAKAAGVPLVVALNKIDRPDATESQVQKTLRQLADAGLQPTEWGGETDIVRTSATTGQGIKELLELLDYQSQLKNLRADFDGTASGVVIEARTEEGRGAVASLLVQQGKLKVGDFVVAGRGFGRVRDIHNDRGVKIREALPPSPVQISGIDMVPDAGDKFYVVSSLKKAEEAADHRRHREREAELAKPKLTLDSLFSQMQDNEVEVKEIKIVLKAAEQGTVDVLTKECEKIGTAEVKVRVLHSAVGGINRSDVQLADASKAIIIGFNVIALGEARTLAEQKGVEIRTYDVIYNITDDLKAAAEGMLAPELRQEVLGHAEVRQVFNISKVGTIAGCYVTDGVIERNAFIRVTRGGVVVQNERVLEQLKRFKDDAKDVRTGMECGMKVVGYDDIKVGDVIECYKQVEFKRTLAGGVVAPEKPKEKKKQ